nr:MAG TPA: hypothetical protein [Caudoviricetes sp.]
MFLQHAKPNHPFPNIPFFRQLHKIRLFFCLFWFTINFQNLMSNLFLFPCYNIIVKKIQKECKNNG